VVDVDDRALILQTFPYSDTSRILKLLCEHHGLRTVIAKGALRPRSRFGGLLEPFTEGQVQFRLKDGREMHTLSGFDLLRSRQSLGRSLEAFAGASLLAELALRFGTAEPEPELYHLIDRELERLAVAAAPDAAATALAAVWQVISALGFEPRLDACGGCGRQIESTEDTRFDMEAGGVACTACRRDGRIVDARSRAELAALCAGEVKTGEGTDWAMHRALLRAFVGTHLTQEHPLRSLELFTDLLPHTVAATSRSSNDEASPIP
jgi:DNA repair protein RecO (recombination protein O)